jgi:hypothetical protein
MIVTINWVLSNSKRHGRDGWFLMVSKETWSNRSGGGRKMIIGCFGFLGRTFFCCFLWWYLLVGRRRRRNILRRRTYYYIVIVIFSFSHLCGSYVRGSSMHHPDGNPEKFEWGWKHGVVGIVGLPSVVDKKAINIMVGAWMNPSIILLLCCCHASSKLFSELYLLFWHGKAYGRRCRISCPTS